MQSTGASVRASPAGGPIVETYEAADELTERPPDGEGRQEALVRGWDELMSEIHWPRRRRKTVTTPTKEDGRINW